MTRAGESPSERVTGLQDCPHGQMRRSCETCDLAESVTLLRETLFAARLELDKWGHGDFRFGNMPRNPNVLTMLAKIDEALDATL